MATYRHGCHAALLALWAIILSPVWTAYAYPNCPADQVPSFLAGFAYLHEHLGAVMGEPLDCERTDLSSGDGQQQTTTGIAVYRKDTNTLMFTNGREAWSLATEGLVHWAGWHGQVSSLGASPASRVGEEQLTVATIGAYPRAEAATIIASLDADGQQLLLDHEGASYLVEIRGGCVDDQALAGRPVFVISSDAFAEPGSRLVLRVPGRECVITASLPL
jgi:hypothetical protein